MIVQWKSCALDTIDKNKLVTQVGYTNGLEVTIATTTTSEKGFYDDNMST